MTGIKPLQVQLGDGALGLHVMASLPCPALPARSTDVATYLADLALRGRKPTIIELHRAALRYLHHIAQLPIPTAQALVTETVAGIHRAPGKALPRQVKGLTWDMMCEVIDAIPMTTLVDTRDRAILLIGYGGALRRSELASIQLEYVTLDDDCMRITLPQSKGDKHNKGTVIVIPRGITRFCPVRAWETWLRQSGLKLHKKTASDRSTTAAFPRIWSPQPRNQVYRPLFLKLAHKASLTGQSQKSSNNDASLPV